MEEYVKFRSKVCEAFGTYNDSAYAIMIYTDEFSAVTYNEYADMQIDLSKLLDIRVFGDNAEFRLFRDYCGNDFYPMIEVTDENMGMDCDYYDDFQYLDIDVKRTMSCNEKGEKVRATGGGWYSLPIPKEKLDGLGIKLRNYVAYDGNGQAYIKTWRLVGFHNDKDR